MAQAAVKRVQELRRASRLPYATIARHLEVPESTLRRWRRQVGNRPAVLLAPGPKKVESVDMKSLMASMDELDHGRERSLGAPALLETNMDRISRRDFYGVLERCRARLRQEEQLGYWHYHWRRVGAVWSMDDMVFGRDENDSNLLVHNVMDVGSRHFFEPLSDDSLPAAKVAANLDNLFCEEGPPIILKADMGSNLIVSDEVGKALTEWCVIPLLSPPRYPRYNGVMERNQGIVRTAVEDMLDPQEACPRRHFKAYAVVGTYRANDLPRDVLGGRTANQVYHERRGEMKTNIRERKKIYEWIKRKQESILPSTAKDRSKWAVNVAWRSATEEWLLQNKVIEIIPKTEKVSTNFGALSAHN